MGLNYSPIELFSTAFLFSSREKRTEDKIKFKKHPWQSGRLHRTHNATSKEHRWFKPNWMQKIFFKR
jgi:hypothetical protein